MPSAASINIITKGGKGPLTADGAHRGRLVRHDATSPPASSGGNDKAPSRCLLPLARHATASTSRRSAARRTARALGRSDVKRRRATLPRRRRSTSPCATPSKRADRDGFGARRPGGTLDDGVDDALQLRRPQPACSAACSLTWDTLRRSATRSQFRANHSTIDRPTDQTVPLSASAGTRARSTRSAISPPIASTRPALLRRKTPLSGLVEREHGELHAATERSPTACSASAGACPMPARSTAASSTAVPHGRRSPRRQRQRSRTSRLGGVGLAGAARDRNRGRTPASERR